MKSLYYVSQYSKSVTGILSVWCHGYELKLWSQITQVWNLALTFAGLGKLHNSFVPQFSWL